MSDATTAPSDFDPEAALLRLRRKEGNWVEWGQSCQHLRKAGYTDQQIFEATGFEPIQQNQIMVAAQVFTSMMEVGVKSATADHYARVGSDSLYELRILGKTDRAAAADFLIERNIDSEGSKEVARSVKEYADLRRKPEGFSSHPGDAVAYQYWRYAAQQNNLVEKTRLIARGLVFAHSNSARHHLEQLLGQAQLPPKPSPKLPLYRLERDEELPRLLPVAGRLPLHTPDLLAVPPAQARGAFGVVNSSWQQWICLPGWQALLATQNPVVVLAANRDLLPDAEADEEILLVIDRATTTWDEFQYFALDRAGQIAIDWSPEPPSDQILGQVVLVLRPKRMLATGDAHDLWQMEE
jgi:hypothetical protein